MTNGQWRTSGSSTSGLPSGGRSAASSDVGADIAAYITECVENCWYCGGVFATLGPIAGMACCSACIGEFGLSTTGASGEIEWELDGGVRVGDNCRVTVVPGEGSILEGEIQTGDGGSLDTTAADFQNYEQCVSRLDCGRSASMGPVVIDARSSLASVLSGSSATGVRLDSGVTTEAPPSLVAGQPDLSFDVSGRALEELDRFQWLYLNVSKTTPPVGYEPYPEVSYWGAMTGRSPGSEQVFGVVVTYPFACFSTQRRSLGLRGRELHRVRYWVGVMNWVRVIQERRAYADLFTGTDAQVQMFMECVSELQAYVAWRPNPALHPDLDCSNFLEYLNVYPHHHIPVWGEIAGAGGLDTADGSGLVGSTSGMYAVVGGSSFSLRRPALAYAGNPGGSDGALFSRLGRMVKAEVWVDIPVGSPEVDRRTEEERQLEAARVGFECVFGDRAAIGTTVSFISAEDDLGSTVSARRCLDRHDLQTVKQLKDRIDALSGSAGWIVDTHDFEQIIADFKRDA